MILIEAVSKSYSKVARKKWKHCFMAQTTTKIWPTSTNAGTFPRKVTLSDKQHSITNKPSYY